MGTLVTNKVVYNSTKAIFDIVRDGENGVSTLEVYDSKEQL